MTTCRTLSMSCGPTEVEFLPSEGGRLTRLRYEGVDLVLPPGRVPGFHGDTFCAEAGHRWFSWRPGKRDWHITALNMRGSVFFGISAIGAYVDPDGQMVSAKWANGGTFLGAVCFLIASILMMPEGRNPVRDHD